MPPRFPSLHGLVHDEAEEEAAEHLDDLFPVAHALAAQVDADRAVHEGEADGEEPRHHAEEAQGAPPLRGEVARQDQVGCGVLCCDTRESPFCWRGN